MGCAHSAPVNPENDDKNSTDSVEVEKGISPRAISNMMEEEKRQRKLAAAAASSGIPILDLLLHFVSCLLVIQILN